VANVPSQQFSFTKTRQGTEPGSKNKKKGDKRGVLGGIEGGRKVTRPVGVIIKLGIAGAD